MKIKLQVAIAAMCILSFLAGAFIEKAWGEEDYCTKNPKAVFVGSVTNPLEVKVQISIFNNEKVNGTDMIGVDAPYFQAVLAPGETKNIEYECGDNSVIYRIVGTNTFKSLDFNVPKSFKDGKPGFEYELKTEKLNI